MEIGRSAPRYQAISTLYPWCPKLRSYLAKYFIIVIHLCRSWFKFAQKSTVMQVASSMCDMELKDFQMHLEKWARLIKDQMPVNEAQENSRIRALTINILKSASYQQKHANKMQVLNYYSTYDHETAWKQIKKAGNSSIHLRQVEYQD